MHARVCLSWRESLGIHLHVLQDSREESDARWGMDIGRRMDVRMLSSRCIIELSLDSGWASRCCGTWAAIRHMQQEFAQCGSLPITQPSAGRMQSRNLSPARRVRKHASAKQSVWDAERVPLTRKKFAPNFSKIEFRGLEPPAEPQAGFRVPR